MRVLVTGAAGFIGFHLSKKLLDKGNIVMGYDNLNNYYDINFKIARLEILRNYPNFKFTKGDLVDKILLNDLFFKFQPEIVVNLAAQAGVRYSIENPQAYMDSNMTGFFHILEACRQFPVKHLIYASSSSVYGANMKVPFSTEDKTDCPVSFYAATKKSNEIMAHCYSKLYNIPATGLRFFTVYGPYGRPDMAYFSFSQKIMRDEPIKIFNNGELYRDFTYIDDIIFGIERVIEYSPISYENPAANKIYNIGNNKPEKLMYFIEILENCLGKKAIKEFHPMQMGDVYQTYADINEFSDRFGFRPDTSLEVGLRKFTEWFLEIYK